MQLPGGKEVSMSFVASQFLIAFLLRNGSATSVLEVFDNLTDKLGVQTFRELFPVILTDNGPEFKDPLCLEHSRTNCLRTRIFYCDPQASWQKPHIERSHEYIRMVLPKGRSFDKLTQDDITLLTNHINSISRDSLDGKCPYDVAKEFIAKKLPYTLGLRKIPADQVVMRPCLLDK
jgi:IS30 family transposase